MRVSHGMTSTLIRAMRIVASMTPGAFNTFLAESLSVEERTVTVFTRALKEAGMMTAGQGRHAPHMLPIDAARAILALMATDRPSEAVSELERWRDMCLSFGECSGALPAEIFAGNPTLEQVLVRLLAVDPDASLWPAFPAFELRRNERSAMLEWGLNEPPRAVFRAAQRTDEDRSQMAGIRRTCLVAPSVLMNVVAGMTVDRFRGSDVQGLPLEPTHPWNNRLTGPARAERWQGMYTHIRARDGDWRKGAE